MLILFVVIGSIFMGCPAPPCGSPACATNTDVVDTRHEDPHAIEIISPMIPVQTVMIPPTVREYHYPRNGRISTQTKCEESSHVGWTQAWINTCERIEYEKATVRDRDRRNVHPTFPHLLEPEWEDIHPVDGSQEPQEHFVLRSIHAATDVTVFSGTSGPHSAIFKYQSNCRQMKRNEDCDLRWSKSASSRRSQVPPACLMQSDQDPLLSEYVFTRIVSTQSERTCPSVFTLSPPVVLPERRNQKTTMEIHEKIGFQHCAELNSSIRLIVEEQVGSTLNRCFDSVIALPPRDLVIFATNAFIRIIQLLHQIHTLGIIHGDIHAGNIAFASLDGCPLDSPQELVLIDFGFAEFFPADLGKEPFVGFGVYGNSNPAFLSPFELAGFRRGRRDDIYRAFEMYIHMLTKGDLRTVFAYTKRNYEGTAHRLLAHMKSSMMLTADEPDAMRYQTLFTRGTDVNLARVINRYPGIGHIRTAFRSDESWLKICSIFSKLELYVRGLSDSKPLSSPDSQPDYEWLLGQAHKILRQLP
jgi:hypothetical protein